MFNPKILISKNVNKNKWENTKVTSMAKLNIYIHSEEKNEENKNNNLKTIDINLNNINIKR